MTESTESLTDQLTGRIEALASAARETADAIATDRSADTGGVRSIDALIVDSVVQRVDEIAADCDDLAKILTGYQSLVDTHRDEAPDQFRTGHDDEGDLAAEPSGADADSPEISEGVRLLATQMSVAGNGPSEIAQRLRDEFGVENSAALVRELFGQ